MGSSEWNEAHWGGVGDEDEDSMSKVKSLKETTLNREGRNKEESLAACTNQEDKKTKLAGKGEDDTSDEDDIEARKKQDCVEASRKVHCCSVRVSSDREHKEQKRVSTKHMEEERTKCECNNATGVEESLSNGQDDQIKMEGKAVGGTSNGQKQGTVRCYCRNKCGAKKSCICKQNNQLCTKECHIGHSCTNTKAPRMPEHVITVSGGDASPSQKVLLWKEICGIQLKKEHLNILRSPMWIDDTIINASQLLLKKQFPSIGSLQSPVLAANCSMQPQVTEFVQVLNTRGNHWIVISTIGCSPGSVNVFDSLHWKLSPHDKKVVACLLNSKEKEIKINYVDVQWQSGGNDCGLFAIAFATSLCAGQNPALASYKQLGMRDHLIQCINNEVMVPFPVRASTRKKLKMKNQNSERVPILIFVPADNRIMAAQWSSA